jgi:hypothetical protein
MYAVTECKVRYAGGGGVGAIDEISDAAFSILDFPYFLVGVFALDFDASLGSFPLDLDLDTDF